MKTNNAIDIPPPVPHLAEFWFSIFRPKYYLQIKLQDSLTCTISRKQSLMKFIFGRQISIEVFYKLILSLWLCIATWKDEEKQVYKVSLWMCIASYAQSQALIMKIMQSFILIQNTQKKGGIGGGEIFYSLCCFGAILANIGCCPNFLDQAQKVS